MREDTCCIEYLDLHHDFLLPLPLADSLRLPQAAAEEGVQSGGGGGGGRRRGFLSKGGRPRRRRKRRLIWRKMKALKVLPTFSSCWCINVSGIITSSSSSSSPSSHSSSSSSSSLTWPLEARPWAWPWPPSPWRPFTRRMRAASKRRGSLLWRKLLFQKKINKGEKRTCSTAISPAYIKSTSCSSSWNYGSNEPFI